MSMVLETRVHILLQNVTEVYYKMRQVFITKCDNFITKCKLLQNVTILLENVTVVTKLRQYIVELLENNCFNYPLGKCMFNRINKNTPLQKFLVQT